MVAEVTAVNGPCVDGAVRRRVLVATSPALGEEARAAAAAAAAADIPTKDDAAAAEVLAVVTGGRSCELCGSAALGTSGGATLPALQRLLRSPDPRTVHVVESALMSTARVALAVQCESCSAACVALAQVTPHGGPGSSVYAARVSALLDGIC